MSKTLREVLLHLRASGIAPASAPIRKATQRTRPSKGVNRDITDDNLIDLLKSCAIAESTIPKTDTSCASTSGGVAGAPLPTNGGSSPPTIHDYAELLQCISHFPNEMKLLTLPIVAQALAAVANASQANREGLRPVDGLLACLIAFTPPLRDYSAHREALIAALSEYLELTPIDDILKIIFHLAPISRNLRRRLLQAPLTVPQLVQLLQSKSTVRGRYLEGIAADCVGQWKLRRPFALSSLKQAALWVVMQQPENATDVEYRTVHVFCENLMQEVLLEFREIRSHLTPLENFRPSTTQGAESSQNIKSAFQIQLQILHQYAFYIVAVAQYAQPVTQRSFIVCEAVKHCRQNLSHSTLPLVVGNPLFGVDGILCGLRYLKGQAQGEGTANEGAGDEEGSESNQRQHSLLYRNTLVQLRANPISKSLLGPSLLQSMSNYAKPEFHQPSKWIPSKVAGHFRQLLQECQDQLVVAGSTSSLQPFQSLVELIEQSIHNSEGPNDEDPFLPTLSHCAFASELLLQKLLSLEDQSLASAMSLMAETPALHSLVDRHCAVLSRYAARFSGVPTDLHLRLPLIILRAARGGVLSREHVVTEFSRLFQRYLLAGEPDPCERAEADESAQPNRLGSVDDGVSDTETSERLGVDGLLFTTHKFLLRVGEHDQGAGTGTPQLGRLSIYAADLIGWLINFISTEAFVQSGAYPPRLGTVLFAARCVAETMGDQAPPDLVPAIWRAFSVPSEQHASLASGENWSENGRSEAPCPRTLPFEDFSQCRAWFQLCASLNLWSPLYLNPVFEWANQCCSVQQNAPFLVEILTYGAATNNDEHKQLESFSTLVDSCIRELLTITAPAAGDSGEQQQPAAQHHYSRGENSRRSYSHTSPLSSPQLLALVSAVFDAATLKHRHGLHALELQLMAEPRSINPSSSNHSATGVFLQSCQTFHLEKVARSALQYWMDRVSKLSDSLSTGSGSDLVDVARSLLQSMYQLTVLLVRVELKGPDLERGVSCLQNGVPPVDLLRLLAEEPAQTSSMFRKIEADGGTLDESLVLNFADHVLHSLKREQDGRAVKPVARSASKVFTHLAHCKAFHSSDRGGELLSDLLTTSVDLTAKQPASNRRGGHQGKGHLGVDGGGGESGGHGSTSTSGRRTSTSKSHQVVGLDEKEISVAFLVITYCETRVSFGAKIDEALVSRLLGDLIPFLAGNPQLNNNFDTLCGLLWCCSVSETLLSKVSLANLRLISQALVDRLEYAEADTSCGNTRALRRLLQAGPKLQGRGCDELFELLDPQSALGW